jgi:hypothetical protein
MFVVVPLDDEAEPKPFLSAKAAREWAETGAFQEYGVERCEIHFVDGEVSKDEAIAAVQAGKSEKRATVHRRMSAHEIEVNSRRDAEAELRSLGLVPKEK